MLHATGYWLHALSFGLWVAMITTGLRATGYRLNAKSYGLMVVIETKHIRLKLYYTIGLRTTGCWLTS